MELEGTGERIKSERVPEKGATNRRSQCHEGLSDELRAFAPCLFQLPLTRTSDLPSLQPPLVPRTNKDVACVASPTPDRSAN